MQLTSPDLFTQAIRDESFRSLQAKGLSGSYQKVIDALRTLGKADYHMIAEETKLPVTSVTGRVKELRDKAIVDVVGSHVGRYGKVVSLYMMSE